MQEIWADQENIEASVMDKYLHSVTIFLDFRVHRHKYYVVHCMQFLVRQLL